MTDTDPKMMRRQQALDTGRRIPEDETHRPAERSDLDPASRTDREAAQKGMDPQDANETMDDIFQGNRGAATPGKAADEMMEDAATDGNAALARKDRSLLGE